MSLPIFPTLPGQGWSVKKTPTFSTRVASHSSGREVRASLYAHALYQFELSFDALDSSGANAGLQAEIPANSDGLLDVLRRSAGNVSLRRSDRQRGDSPRPSPPATARPNVSSLGRSIGGYYEPASYVTSIASVTVAGAATSAYTFTAPNLITFTTAPASGATIAASFAYAFQCRFLDDTAEFENFASGLWKIGGLKFRQVR